MIVVAKIPNLYGDGRDAHMTYYKTRRGAEVFAAGAFSLSSAIGQPIVQTLVENLWAHMSGDQSLPSSLAMSTS